MQSRTFLVCGRSRVPADADDHVDAADGRARGRRRQAGDGGMLARNGERPAGIPEKEVMTVTDVGVETGVAGIHHGLVQQPCLDELVQRICACSDPGQG